MKGSSQTIRPQYVVFGVMIAVILLSWFVPVIRRAGVGEVEAHVSLDSEEAKHRTEPALYSANRTAPVQAIFNGEVYRTAERMKAAKALATIASLYLASETMSHRQPKTVEELVAGLVRSHLIPSGLTQADDLPGTLRGVTGTLYVRYRPAPLGVEIVSVGRVRMDGPAMLARVPSDDPETEEGAALYIATTLTDLSIPSGFASKSEIVALGWQLEPQRKSILSAEDKSKLLRWVEENHP